jgi:hypothetical protein
MALGDPLVFPLPALVLPADLATRLSVIEAQQREILDLLRKRTPKQGAKLTYTPRQLAKKINRSYRWVVDRCAAGVIPTTTRRAPYLIPMAEADEMFSTGKTIFSR